MANINCVFAQCMYALSVCNHLVHTYIVQTHNSNDGQRDEANPCNIICQQFKDAKAK